MKVEHLEIFIVAVIVCIQLKVFLRTFRQIVLFKRIIPDENTLIVSKIFVPTEHLNNKSPREILENVNSYRRREIHYSSSYVAAVDTVDGESAEYYHEEEEDDDMFEEETVELKEISIVESKTAINENFSKILFSINNYLIRNSGASSDFNLIKDVVERNTDVIEEDINISVGVPLYLGLMGTMLGIVIGLFNMPGLDAGTNANLDAGIESLIGGVKIAMIASFAGLFFTIVNSGWTFKGARSFCEARKNMFYTFVQIQLLPIINQGLANTLDSLQRNLLKFNDEFSGNLTGLKGIFDSNRHAIREQKELLDVIDKSKVSEMTRYNVTVLQQLDVSVKQFEKFNGYLTNVNQFVDNSRQIISATNDLLSRTADFKLIADNLDDRLNQSQQLLNFLSEHFRKLEEQKEFTSNAVADVGFAIGDAFKELKQHIVDSSEALKQFTVDETAVLKEAMSASKTNLANLDHLATLKADVVAFKLSSASQGERLKNTLEQLNEHMTRSIVILERIHENSNKSFSVTIRNLFKSRK